jgi:hypothetical protein
MRIGKPDHSDRLEIESNAFGRQGSEGSLIRNLRRSVPTVATPLLALR